MFYGASKAAKEYDMMSGISAAQGATIGQLSFQLRRRIRRARFFRVNQLLS